MHKSITLSFMTPFSQVLCSVPYNTEIGMLVTFYPHLKAQPGKGPSLNSLALQPPSLQQQVKGACPSPSWLCRESPRSHS